MKWYLSVIKNYAQFSGRARRKEYWMFVLFNMIFSYGLQGLDYWLGIGVLGSIYSLAVLIPSIAVTVRRLHDTGKSGWYYAGLVVLAIGLVVAGIVGGFDFSNFDAQNINWMDVVSNMMVYLALIGVAALVFLFFMIQDSQPGTNQYGPNPKEEGEESGEYQLYE